MGVGDCGSADDQSQWFKNLGDLDCLGHWETSNFQSTSQPTAGQSNSQPFDSFNETQDKSAQGKPTGLAILSAGQTFKHHTPSLIARASPPPSVGGYKGISIVARPARPPQVHPSLSRSGFFSSFAFCYGGLVRLRFASAVF